MVPLPPLGGGKILRYCEICCISLCCISLLLSLQKQHQQKNVWYDLILWYSVKPIITTTPASRQSSCLRTQKWEKVSLAFFKQRLCNSTAAKLLLYEIMCLNKKMAAQRHYFRKHSIRKWSISDNTAVTGSRVTSDMCQAGLCKEQINMSRKSDLPSLSHDCCSPL